jgi:hypothetical protein
MPMSGRAGVGLVELVVAMVVGAILLTAALAAQAGLDRITRSRAERAGAQATLRTAAGAFQWELSSLGSDSLAGPDLVSVGPAAVRFRAHRGLIVVCGVAPDSLIVDRSRIPGWRARQPVPGRDSLLLYAPGDSLGPVDGWLPAPIRAGPFARACPGGSAGELFVTAIDSVTLAFWRIPPVTIARVFEVVELAGYPSGTGWQLGQASISGGSPIQPFAGPLDGPGGLRPTAWDRDGLAGSVPGTAAGVDIAVRALARREVAVGPGRPPVARDSVVLSIRFGNVP